MLPSHFESFQFQRFFPDATHAFCALFATALAIVLLYVAIRQRSVAADPKDPLEILLYVITPVSSLWPPKYRALAVPRQSKILYISLKMLIEGVISGDIELRSPESDIERLLQGNGAIQVKGWVLLFSFGHLWLSALWWWMKLCLHAGSYKSPFLNSKYHPQPSVEKSAQERSQGNSLNPSPQSKCTLKIEIDSMRLTPFRSLTAVSGESSSSMPRPRRKPLNQIDPAPRVVSILPELLPTFPSQIMRKLAIATTLDSAPYPHMETALREFQSAIAPGELGLLEFTSCEQVLPVLSKRWILLALPFFYSTRHLPPRTQRPTIMSPFTNTLPSIITSLESGASHCTILSVQNVSVHYAHLLDVYAQGLEDKATRERFLEGFDETDAGLRAWRAEILWARWENACYAHPFLTRWVVCAKKPL